ncbi:MAG: class I SAM-dependent methyltransferase [Phycisphaerales bacterium]|nr:class I SAM-dependent methyltransferase [Phycisphaerales bacterium]
MSVRTTVRKASKKAPSAQRGLLSRYDMYELCVQSPTALVPFLKAVHGGEPTRLGEDFCGTAALSRRWIIETPEGSAVGVDLDPEPLKIASQQTPKDAGMRLKLIKGDVLKLKAAKSSAGSGAGGPFDLIFVGNFSIGEIHRREDLVKYFRTCVSRLAKAKRRSPGGVFVCDIYGGETAFVEGALERTHPGPPTDPALRIKYTWQQRTANALTGMVENALHFRTVRAGVVEQEFTDAFVYNWRLWSVPELREAMLEAGFSTTEVYAKLVDAVDDQGKPYVRPVTDASELEESFIVCVVGRV